MKPFDVGELLLLAALWGASFLFMRVAAPEFGPAALVAVRFGLAAVVLLPIVAWRGQWAAMWHHWRPIAIVGILNSALPFLLYSYAALSITAGLASIFNAASPLFAAVIAWLWLGDRLTPPRVAGLAIGFAGVVGLAWEKASFTAGGSALAIAACLGATFCYGLGANYTKRALQTVPSIAVAGGSQLAAGLLIALPALWWWPAEVPSSTAWLAAIALAVPCTGFAYLLYFRLIARVGPGNAIAVTFLIPGFAVAWGAWFLDETIGIETLAGCAVILLGTALATGVIGPRKRVVVAAP